MRHPPSLYWLYGRDYLFPALLLSAACWSGIYFSGPVAIGVSLLLKLGFVAVGLYVLRQRRGAEIFFYRNVGMDERWLLAAPALLDLLVYGCGVWLLINWLG